MQTEQQQKDAEMLVRAYKAAMYRFEQLSKMTIEDFAEKYYNSNNKDK